MEGLGVPKDYVQAYKWFSIGLYRFAEGVTPGRSVNCRVRVLVFPVVSHLLRLEYLRGCHFKRECQEKRAPLQLNADFSSAFSPTVWRVVFLRP
jgi:hypothetical protein